MTDQKTQTPAAGAEHLTEANFASTVKSAGTPVMVDFYAEWCGPCKLAAPIIDRLAKEFAGKLKIVKVDVDENRGLAMEHGVMSIPTVLIVKQDGEKMAELDRQIGFPGEDGYRQMIAKVVPASQAAPVAKAA